MNRRDFLLLRRAADREVELSCERLYMRYVDAESEGTTDALFASLTGALIKNRSVRLVQTSWLSSPELRRRLDDCLSAFRAAGGRVLKGSPC